jgi:hypothetical protein
MAALVMPELRSVEVAPNGGWNPMPARLVDTADAAAKPMLSMQTGSRALSGQQTNPLNVQDDLLSTKAAPELNTYRRSLRCRRSSESSLTGLE